MASPAASLALSAASLACSDLRQSEVSQGQLDVHKSCSHAANAGLDGLAGLSMQTSHQDMQHTRSGLKSMRHAGFQQTLVCVKVLLAANPRDWRSRPLGRAVSPAHMLPGIKNPTCSRMHSDADQAGLFAQSGQIRTNKGKGTHTPQNLQLSMSRTSDNYNISDKSNYISSTQQHSNCSLIRCPKQLSMDGLN